METLLKLNKRKHIFMFFMFLIFSVISLGCSSSHKNITLNPNQDFKIGDTINMSGYLIYDGKKGIALFLEKEALNIERLSKDDIFKLISESTNIILIRDGLEKYRNSEFISLTLCNKDERLIVKKKELLFNRFYIVKLENFTFYKVSKKYEDSKSRFLLCKEEWDDSSN